MGRAGRANFGIRAGGLLAFIGAVVAIGALFLRGWLTVRASFAAADPSGAGALRRIGIEVDKPVIAVAEQVIGGAIPATMWQVQSQIYRIIALLLALAALLLLGASFVRRGRRGVCRAALAASVAAAILMAIAALQLRAQVAALPGQITAALGTGGLLTQAVGTAIGTPQVAANPGRPLIAMAVAVVAALLGAALAAVASVHRHGGDRRRGHGA